ncbi:MAG: hypothetical protein E3J21_04070 [Anaerolineales bacterium]|nr:MAG: hypothetical protein E3J21_04070 [Anaerolineales bacterium]
MVEERYSSGMKILLYIVSFFIPLAGIIIGVIYMGKEDEESKALGKVCLIIAIVAFVLVCCCVAISFGTSFIPLLMEGNF